MQRTGRKGHAQFRVVVQDSRVTPTSGRVVAGLGSYNPHTKEAVLDNEKAAFYLKNGAQPSERVAVLFKKEGIKLPKWVELADKKQKTTKNVEKLRKNRPAEPVTEAAPAAEPATTEEEPTAAEETAVEEVVTEAEAPAEQASEETSSES